MKTKITGFTLTELLIVVAIVAILAAVGYPAYNDQVQKTRRANAQAELVELASFMERWYTQNYTYQTSTSGDPTLPFTESPKDGGAKFYDLTVATNTGPDRFTLTATPKNGQAADFCGTMTYTNTGSFTPAANCWP